MPEWGKRAERAHLNLLANLPAFAALVLVAGLAVDESSQIGKKLFPDHPPFVPGRSDVSPRPTLTFGTSVHG